MVRDDAGMFGTAMGEVTSAAEALQNAGAQVYVRTFPTTGTQSTAARLEHYIESQCPDWQAANGGRKENLVAIIYADRDAEGKHSIVISTGGRIDSVVPPTQIDRIRAQVIIAELKRGHATKAFVDGLNAIRASYEGSSATTTPQSTPVQETIPVISVTPQPPADLTGLWFFFGLAVLAVFGWVAYISLHGRKQRRAARLKAQQVYNSVTAQISAIDENKTALRAHYVILSSGLPVDERQKIEAALAQVAKTYDDACADFGTKRTSDLEKRGLSADEYDTLRETYQGILDKLNAAAGVISENGSHLDDLQAQIVTAPKKVEEAKAALNKLPECLRQVKQAGFRTETYEALGADAQKVINEASDALTNKKFFEAIAHVDQAGKILEQAYEGQKLPDRKADLDNRIAAVKARIDKAKGTVLLCKPIIDRMDTEFARQSFESVVGNGSQATEHINWCDRGIPMAADFATMEKQEWQKAADIIAEANGHLDRVDSLVSSITAIERSLNTAQQEAPSDIQNAEQDLRAAQEYISSHKNDIHTDAGAKLAEAGETLIQARAELQNPKPDYFETVKLARKAHEVADEILTAAKTEYEAQERLRQKAASALRYATSRVSKAREYIEDRKWFVGKAAKDKLEEAERYLDGAQECSKSGDLDGAVKWSDLADEAGKAAYQQARDDAEPERSCDAYTCANEHYAPSNTTIFVNESSGQNYISASAGSSSSNSSWGTSSSWFGSGSDSSSSFSFGDVADILSIFSSSGGGSDSSSSFSSSGGGSDSSSSW